MTVIRCWSCEGEHQASITWWCHQRHTKQSQMLRYCSERYGWSDYAPGGLVLVDQLFDPAGAVHQAKPKSLIRCYQKQKWPSRRLNLQIQTDRSRFWRWNLVQLGWRFCWRSDVVKSEDHRRPVVSVASRADALPNCRIQRWLFSFPLEMRTGNWWTIIRPVNVM